MKIIFLNKFFIYSIQFLVISTMLNPTNAIQNVIPQPSIIGSPGILPK